MLFYVAMQDLGHEGYSKPTFITSKKKEFDAYLKGAKDSCGLTIKGFVCDSQNNITEYKEGK